MLTVQKTFQKTLSSRKGTLTCSSTCLIDESVEERSRFDRPFDLLEIDEDLVDDFGKRNAVPVDLRREASELAKALEDYKLIHRRRYFGFEEMVALLHAIGYHR